MSSFTDQLDLRDLGDRTFQLLSSFRFFIDAENSNECIFVPEGFITDFASVPRPLWSILPPYGRHGKAAVIHDGLYKTKGLFGKYTRKQCDRIFLTGMEVLNVQLLTRRTMYSGVRIWGWYEWNKPMDEKIRKLYQRTDLTWSEIVQSPKPTSILL